MSDPAGYTIDAKTIVEIVIALVGLGTLWGRVEFGIDPTAKEAKRLAEQASRDARDYTDKVAEDFKRLTDEIKKLAIDAHTLNAALQQSMAMFREKVATEYVSREAMKDLEGRLSNDIGKVEALVEKMEQSIMRAIGEISTRMDRDRNSRPRTGATSS